MNDLLKLADRLETHGYGPLTGELLATAIRALHAEQPQDKLDDLLFGDVPREGLGPLELLVHELDVLADAFNDRAGASTRTAERLKNAARAIDAASSTGDHRVRSAMLEAIGIDYRDA